MLLNFTFKNYMSYADTCDFSMLANKDKSHEDNLIKIGKDRISKTRIIYGSNASGKTSFINALDFIKIFSMMSNNLVENNRIGVNPYKFRKDAYKVPSEFSLTFVKNNVKYNYSFSCTYEKVINEKLDVYNSAKPTNIFTRTNTDDYKFNTDVKKLNEIKTKNTKNKLYLLTAATWNYEKVKPVVEYILNDIIVLHDISQPTKYNINYIIEHNDLEEYKKFCLDFLNNADISISDFEINMQKVKELGKRAEFMTKIMNVIVNNDPEKMDKFGNSDIFNIKTIHNIKDEDSSNSYPLELIEESIGTQQLFYFAPALFYTFKEGKTLLIDEIDRSLHPLLVEYIIKKFYDAEINTKNAQLICNTHDTNLLNLDIFRRDEIWFTERNNATASTEMYALSDFSPRKDENIEKAYLLGRYGGIPFIKEG
mgnify:FL=1